MVDTVMAMPDFKTTDVFEDTAIDEVLAEFDTNPRSLAIEILRLKRRLDQLEASSAAAAAAAAAAANQQKQTAPLPQLPEDVVSVIFSFLDLRGLYKVTFTSKKLISQLSYAQVIMKGCYAQKFSVLENIKEALGWRRCWVPSPARMLRLLNARRCENPDCRKTCASLKSGYFLMNLCNECLRKRRYQSFISKRDEFYQKHKTSIDIALRNPRIVCQGNLKVWMWSRPRTDNMGEPIGGVLSLDDIQQMALQRSNPWSYLRSIGAPTGNDYDLVRFKINEQSSIYSASRMRRRQR